MSDDTRTTRSSRTVPLTAAAIPIMRATLENPAIAEGPDGASPERGMPELGQYGSGRPRAWWLTPLAHRSGRGRRCGLDVHGLLARHDAAAQARRDAALDQPVQGRIFGDPQASAAGMPASAAHPASAPEARACPRRRGAHAFAGEFRARADRAQLLRRAVTCDG